MTDYDHIAELVGQAQEGSHEAFTELYKLYFPRVWYAAIARVGDENRANNISQEVFLRVLTKIENLRNPRAFEKWLFTLLRHEIGAEQQGAKREICESDTSLSEDTMWLPDIHSDPEEAFELRENHARVAAAVRQLSSLQKEAIILRYLHELSVSEIASALGVSAATISKRLFDAHRQLNMRLKECPSDEELTSILRTDAARFDSHLSEELVIARLRALVPSLLGTGILGPTALARVSAFSSNMVKAAVSAAQANIRVAGNSSSTASGSTAAFVLKITTITAMISLIISGSAYGLSRWSKPATPQGSLLRTMPRTVPTVFKERKLPESVLATATFEATSTAKRPQANDAVAEPDSERDGQESDASQRRAMPKLAPVVAPSINVAHTTLCYPLGTIPSAERIFADCGATAYAADGSSCELTLSGREELDPHSFGTQPVFLHARDKSGHEATTKTITVEFM